MLQPALKPSSAPETSPVATTLAIAALVTVEFSAMMLLSRLLRPSFPFLLISFGLAFAAYVALVRVARAAGIPIWVWFAVALILRTPLLGAGVSLSDDVWRYLHDGRAQVAGVNPFRYPPAAAEAAAYAGDEYSLINHPELPTIYPPFAQLMFRLAATLGATLLSWKLVLLAFDMGIGVALLPILRRRGLPASMATAYLLHPLPILEFAGNAHVDAVAILPLIVALAVVPSRSWLAGIGMAASVAGKYLTLPLVPFLARGQRAGSGIRYALGFATAMVILYLPFRDPWPVGSLGEFARTFEFNSPVYQTLASLAGPTPARWMIGTMLLGVIAWLWHRKFEPLDAAFIWTAAVLLLSPILHPWYVTWLVPFLAWRSDLWVLAWSGTVVLAYQVLPVWWSTGDWRLSIWARVFEYAPVYGLMLWAVLSRRRGLDTPEVTGESAPA
jgi:hypothetical protein